MAFYKKFSTIDWTLLLATLPLIVAGLVTMSSFGARSGQFFTRQIIWVVIALAIFFLFSFVDWRFLKKGGILMVLFLVGILSLTALILFGKIVRGVTGWFDAGLFAIQPVDPIKIILILILAKYFARRHVEIAAVRHILISGIYTLIPFVLIFAQPDFGSAMIILVVWFGMLIASGISWKHIGIVVLTAIVLFSVAWLFVFQPYQKARIISFMDPLHDIQGTGYNAFQSVIAVGSGQFFGKGIGYGSQSRLEFLPEHQTDFIFAAFVEEWGFVGALFLFIFYVMVIWRILQNAEYGQSNFESLYGIGLAILLGTHFIIHVGMNIGLLPVTGTNLPFVSYGGSNMVTTFAALGILMGMRRYGTRVAREERTVSFLGE